MFQIGLILVGIGLTGVGIGALRGKPAADGRLLTRGQALLAIGVGATSLIGGTVWLIAAIRTW